MEMTSVFTVGQFLFPGGINKKWDSDRLHCKDVLGQRAWNVFGGRQ